MPHLKFLSKASKIVELALYQTRGNLLQKRKKKKSNKRLKEA